MKNITLSAQDSTIDALRRVAQAQNKTVNDLFREWAEQLAASERQKRLKALESSFDKLHFTSERTYTREEMNRR